MEATSIKKQLKSKAIELAEKQGLLSYYEKNNYVSPATLLMKFKSMHDAEEYILSACSIGNDLTRFGNALWDDTQKLFDLYYEVRKNYEL